MRDDALHPVMTAGTPRFPDPQPPGIQRHVVIDHQDILRRRIKIRSKRSDTRSRLIHERHRLHDHYFHAANDPGPVSSSELSVRQPDPMSLREFRRHRKTDIVAAAPHTLCRISESGNDLHNSFLFLMTKAPLSADTGGLSEYSFKKSHFRLYSTLPSTYFVILPISCRIPYDALP